MDEWEKAKTKRRERKAVEIVIVKEAAWCRAEEANEAKTKEWLQLTPTDRMSSRRMMRFAKKGMNTNDRLERSGREDCAGDHQSSQASVSSCSPRMRTL